jgi:transposase
MFLRFNKRKKNGKTHRYFSVVENRRVAAGGSVQRRVLYLGEINDSQEAAWRKTLNVFDEDHYQYRELSLFPDDRQLPQDAANAISVKLTEMQLRRPRAFGDCWLACLLWDELQLSPFWQKRLDDSRGDVPWSKVIQLLAVNRLIDPGSELRVHRQWFLNTAMDELLGVDFAVAGKDRLYRCLDRLLEHKEEMCQFLAQRWRTLFDASFDVLLYDLTSTYFEGLCEQIPKAKHGYSRDGRSDCRQVVIALVVTPDGLPLAYEVLAGNTLDKTTLKDVLAKIESMYGKARRTWVMDRGIPTEATLSQMRADGMQYLVGTPRKMLDKLEQDLVDKPWHEVHAGMKVKLLEKDGEIYVLAHSSQRQDKEKAMRRRKFKAYVRGLHAARRRCKPKKGGRRIKRDELLGKLAVLRKEAGKVAAAVKIQIPPEGKQPTLENFTYRLDKEGYEQSLAQDGSYVLRSNVTGVDAPTLWSTYTQLTWVEAAFKSMKSDLAIRPIHHQLGPRVEAHILVAYLGYCLMCMLRKKLAARAPGLSPMAVLEQLAAIRMVDVCLPTSDGRWLIMPRHTEPEMEQLVLLEKLELKLPDQPPPRLRGGNLLLPGRS